MPKGGPDRRGANAVTTPHSEIPTPAVGRRPGGSAPVAPTRPMETVDEVGVHFTDPLLAELLGGENALPQRALERVQEGINRAGERIAERLRSETKLNKKRKAAIQAYFEDAKPEKCIAEAQAELGEDADEDDITRRAKEIEEVRKEDALKRLARAQARLARLANKAQALNAELAEMEISVELHSARRRAVGMDNAIEDKKARVEEYDKKLSPLAIAHRRDLLERDQELLTTTYKPEAERKEDAAIQRLEEAKAEHRKAEQTLADLDDIPGTLERLTEELRALRSEKSALDARIRRIPTERAAQVEVKTANEITEAEQKVAELQSARGAVQAEIDAFADKRSAVEQAAEGIVSTVDDAAVELGLTIPPAAAADTGLNTSQPIQFTEGAEGILAADAASIEAPIQAARDAIAAKQVRLEEINKEGGELEQVDAIEDRRAKMVEMRRLGDEIDTLEREIEEEKEALAMGLATARQRAAAIEAQLIAYEGSQKATLEAALRAKRGEADTAVYDAITAIIHVTGNIDVVEAAFAQYLQEKEEARSAATAKIAELDQEKADKEAEANRKQEAITKKDGERKAIQEKKGAANEIRAKAQATVDRLHGSDGTDGEIAELNERYQDLSLETIQIEGRIAKIQLELEEELPKDAARGKEQAASIEKTRRELAELERRRADLQERIGELIDEIRFNREKASQRSVESIVKEQLQGVQAGLTEREIARIRDAVVVAVDSAQPETPIMAGLETVIGEDEELKQYAQALMERGAKIKTFHERARTGIAAVAAAALLAIAAIVGYTVIQRTPAQEADEDTTEETATPDDIIVAPMPTGGSMEAEDATPEPTPAPTPAPTPEAEPTPEVTPEPTPAAARKPRRQAPTQRGTISKPRRTKPEPTPAPTPAPTPEAEPTPEEDIL